MIVRSDSGGNGDRDRRLHVLEILGNAIVGGMERYVENLIRHAPSDQFRFTCLCPFESPFTATLRQIGVPVFIASIQDDPPWRSIQAAVEVIRHFGVGLVHAHMPKAHILAGLAGSVTGTPVVATVHTMDITSHELGICRTVESHLITVCQQAFTQALAMGIPPERLSLIPNGVDLDRFTPTRDRGTFRQSMGVPVDAPLVGFVGRLAPEKGPDQFLRAAEYVHRKRSDVHFVLIGEGELLPELQAMIERMCLGDVAHLAGLQTDTSIIYPALDVLAMTSRSEGTPFALLEAMACGLPAVAIGVGGVREVIEVGTTGLLAGIGDWQGVGIALSELLSDRDRLQRMGQMARRRAEAWFSLRSSISRTTEVLLNLANGESRPRAVWRSTRPTVGKAR